MRKYELVMLAMATVAASGPVYGHAKLLSSEPAANAHVSTAPTTLRLQFDTTVKLAKFALARDGVVVPIELDPALTPVAKYDIALPALKSGHYTVTWSALTVDDGHVVHGTFSFVVQGAAS